MKKIFLVIIIALTFSSCNSKKEDKKQEPKSASGAPKLTDPELQKFANEYTAYSKAYVDAYNSGDSVKIAEYVIKGGEFTERGFSLLEEFSRYPDEWAKWQKFLEQLLDQEKAASKKYWEYVQKRNKDQ
jgi:hypothetical protein